MNWVAVAIGSIAFGGLVAGMAYVRLAISDPKIWHVPIADQAEAKPGLCADQIVASTNGARSACVLPDQPEEVLARLAAIAEEYPRTVRLAGSPAEGRMTWIARSRVMGFPDYITAEVVAVPEGTRLDVHARLRFGGSDLGVNAKRLKQWLAQI